MGSLYLIVVLGAALSGIPGLVDRRHGGRTAARILAVATLCALAVAGLAILGGVEGRWSLPWAILGVQPTVAVDAVGAWFLVPSLLIPACGAVYATTYWRDEDHPDTAPLVRLCYGLVTAAMALLCAAADSVTFLFAWEIMAIAAFLLVATDHRRERDARTAAWIYLVAAHVGALALFAAFAWLQGINGHCLLGPLPTGLAGSATGTWLFWLLLIGFGCKAGIMPLHIWLPPAHAAAPSHVSAMLSGVVLKMGILGIVRMFQWFPDPPLWWGGTLVGLGVASGILGVAFAIGSHDLKRLLAWHSIENIGIILLGLGLGAVGITLQQPLLAALGFAGGLLHVLNHSLFKSLLFFAAGAAIHATGTRDIDRMGGLARTMPWTAGAFLVGAVAICGLPPFNGFVSELLIYVGAFRALADRTWAWAALIVVALALIGGLALACFVKAYGSVFLGQARDAAVPPGHEPGRAMLAPMALLAAACALIGLLPLALTPVLDRLVAALAPSAPPLPGMLPFPSLSILALATLVLSWLVWRDLHRAIGTPRRTGTWDCGYAAPTARMQYTASSLAQTLVHAGRYVLWPIQHLPAIQMLFPLRSSFHSHVPDTVLDRGMIPFAHGWSWLAGCIKRLQTGHIQLYLLYVVATLVLLVVWMLHHA